MQHKDTLRAKASAAMIENIQKQMGEWKLDQLSHDMLPNFSMGTEFTGLPGQRVMIDRCPWTAECWAGTDQYVTDAKGAMSRKAKPADKESLYHGIALAERSSLALALLLELFAINDLPAYLCKLRKVPDMAFLTVDNDDVTLFREVLGEWK